MISGGRISGVCEVVGTFPRCEGLKQLSNLIGAASVLGSAPPRLGRLLNLPPLSRSGRLRAVSLRAAYHHPQSSNMEPPRVVKFDCQTSPRRQTESTRLQPETRNVKLTGGLQSRA